MFLGIHNGRCPLASECNMRSTFEELTTDLNVPLLISIAWFETDPIHQTKQGKVSPSLARLSDLSYTPASHMMPHSEHKLDSQVINEFTTNDVITTYGQARSRKHRLLVWWVEAHCIDPEN